MRGGTHFVYVVLFVVFAPVYNVVSGKGDLFIEKIYTHHLYLV